MKLIQRTFIFSMCSALILSGCNNADSTTFSLSGTIAQAADTAGIVLSDSLGHTVTLSSGATSFTFNNGTPYLYTNTQYKVTVQQQPKNERCTIANATGTASGTNVTNVTVTCLTPQQNPAGAWAGSTASSTPTDGTGTAATFSGSTTTSMTKDSNGNIYVADAGLLRKITPSSDGTQGIVTTLTLQDSSGNTVTPDIRSIAMNSTNTAIYATTSDYLVKKIAIATDSSNNTTYTATTLAGSTTAGSTNANGTSASFGTLEGIAVDSSENVYVMDAGTAMAIRKIDTGGNVTTLAGSGQTAHTDGTGTAASFDFSSATYSGMVIDSLGSLYVVESSTDYDIRKITSAGVVSTLAGSGTQSLINGLGTTAAFTAPHAIAIDSNDMLYVVDGTSGSDSVRLVTTVGDVTTLSAPSTSSGPFNTITTDASNNLYVLAYPSSMAEILKVTFQ